MQQQPLSSHPIILFDGVCNLCSNSVQFVIKHDPKSNFRFASLQSDFGQKVLAENRLSFTQLNSFILLQDGVVYQRSTAALMVAKQLQGGWKLLGRLLIVPAILRDGVYNFVARNRYKWFGKKESCWVPSPHLQKLFIS